MLSALISFLGGSVFRMIWGEISSFLNKKQDHEHELEMLQIQMEVDDKSHARNLETLRLQNELGVRMVEVERDAAIEKGDSDAFTEAMKTAFRPTGIAIIDAWNGGIRPMYATIAAILWVLKLYSQNFKMDDFDISLVAVIVGFFFADRSLRRNGK